jgi:hypothetical protein
LIRCRHPLASLIDDKAGRRLSWVLQILLRHVLLRHVLLWHILLWSILILNILLQDIRLCNLLRGILSRMLHLHMLLSSLLIRALWSLLRRHPPAPIIHDESIARMLRRMLPGTL